MTAPTGGDIAGSCDRDGAGSDVDAFLGALPAAPVLERVVASCRTAGLTLGVAESMTAGQLALSIVAIPDSGEVLRGGVVAYDSEVKFDVLGVRRGPVVCAEAAIQMAIGVRALLGADIGVATTGVAGPTDQDGEPPGTLFVAVAGPDADVVVERHDVGDADDRPGIVRCRSLLPAARLLEQVVSRRG